MKYLLLITLLFPALCFAQWCGHDEMHQKSLLQNSDYALRDIAMQKAWEAYNDAKGHSKIVITGNDTIYEIPIVFHVFHDGGAVGTITNPSDQKLYDLVDYVNKSFEATWNAYPNVNNGGVKVPVRFVLAQTAPDCSPTNGIVRIDGSGIPNYLTEGVQFGSSTTGVPEATIMNMSKWPIPFYFNIWIVTSINGANGYATEDKVFIRVVSTEPGESTLVHELGHALGLKHIFQGDADGNQCPDNNNCYVDGDKICDTEPCIRYPNCFSNLNPCTGNTPYNERYNFMNYTDCPDRFSPGQSERIKFNLTYFNPYVYSHTGDPFATITPATCNTTSKFSNNSNFDDILVYIKLNTLKKQSTPQGTTGNIAYHTLSCYAHTLLTGGQRYPFEIATDVPTNMKLYIDYNNDGTYQGNELAFASISAHGLYVHSDTITIPATAIFNTKLRMRVVVDEPANTNLSSCNALAIGQAEDFSVTIIPGLSVNETVTAPYFKVYPQPATNTLFIDSKEPLLAAHLTNVLGQTFALPVSHAQKEYDISHLLPGYYVLHAQTPIHIVTQKILVAR